MTLTYPLYITASWSPPVTRCSGNTTGALFTGDWHGRPGAPLLGPLLMAFLSHDSRAETPTWAAAQTMAARA